MLVTATFAQAFSILPDGRLNGMCMDACMGVCMGVCMAEGMVAGMAV